MERLFLDGSLEIGSRHRYVAPAGRIQQLVMTSLLFDALMKASTAMRLCNPIEVTSYSGQESCGTILI
jgi:hypothetical protein